MGVKEQYEAYAKWKRIQVDYFNRGLAKMFLRLPIPMSYELWSLLHEIVEKELEE